jgi:hypothetical protein
MSTLFAIVAVAALVIVVAVSEVTSAVLPTLIVILLVPPEQRAELTALVDATRDRSRRLRVFPVLRIGVIARKLARAAEPERHHPALIKDRRADEHRSSPACLP